MLSRRGSAPGSRRLLGHGWTTRIHTAWIPPPQLTLGSQPPTAPVGGWPGVLAVCLKAARLHVWP
ncbi:hypothetical protein D2E70_15575 [Mycobacteroides abscessus]|nr:hypothetical protein D2E70_15575 [Mycobacteroides abscessus]